jgi:hypothetical protein
MSSRAPLALLLLVSCSRPIPQTNPFSGAAEIGDRLTYEISLQISGASAIMPGSPRLAGALELKGDWELRVIAENELSACFAEIRGVNIKFAEQEISDELTKSFRGECVRARRAADGTIREVAYPPRQPRVVRAAAELLLIELPFPDVRTLDGTFPGAAGSGPLRFERMSTDGTQAKWLRTKNNYQLLRPQFAPLHQDPNRSPQHELTHRFELTINEQNVLVDARGEERLTVTTALGEIAHAHAINARLTGWQRSQTVETPPPVLEVLPLGTLESPAGDDRAQLEQQAAGVSAEDVLAYARQVAQSGFVDDHRERFYRALGRMRIEPELAIRVGSMLEKTKKGGPGRGYLFDLLANAGTAEAEAELVRRLQTQEQDQELVDFVMRLGFVRHPSDLSGTFTLGLMRRRFVSPPDHLTENLALAAGTLSLRLSQNGALSGAAILRFLEDRLERAEDMQTIALMLRALANTRSDGVTPHALRHAKHRETRVRSAAALALRFSSGSTVAGTLEALVRDPERIVQASALTALQSIESVNVERLVQYTVEGRIDPFNYAAMWSLVSKRQNPELKRRLAAHIAADPATVAYLKAEAKRYLDAH